MKRTKQIIVVLLTVILTISMLMVFASCSKCKEGHIYGKSGVCVNCGEKRPVTELPKVDKPHVAIHYQRTDGAYDKWGFWLWVQGSDGKLFSINGSDEYGGIAYYPIDDIGSGALANGIGIIPRLLSSWTKDINANRLLNLADFTKDENNYYHIYIKQGDINLYMDAQGTLPEVIRNAVFATAAQVTVTTSANFSKVELLQADTVIATATHNGTTSLSVDFPQSMQADIGKIYSVKVTFASGKVSTQAVSVSSLYSTDDFNEKYAYDGDDLGAILSADKTQTTFKVWSPISQSIKLNIYSQGASNGSETYLVKQVDMVRGDKGVWYHQENDNLAGKYYTYTVTNAKYPNGREIVDPYAKSAGVNGVRGQVVDFDDQSINPEGWDSVTVPSYDRKELVVWETHVADVTSSTTWTTGNAVTDNLYRKKFLGMIQTGTTYTADGVTVSTGFDHIKELGVNAVQLVPIFDQANDEVNTKFNWGYNPLNYNVVEGCYSTDATNGYLRINEFKQLVQAYNNAGIGIIMDVVYNHTASNVGNNFDVLMPGYYYRYTDNGSSSNGSGCGNDTASENYMFRKFMIDSACFWAKEYKLMGFRFDLMGLHDVATMNMLVDELQKINPNIVVYGEPWDLTTSSNATLATQNNANRYSDFGQFNDQTRDALIKGGLSSVSERGWITTTSTSSSTDVAKIIGGLKGQTGSATHDPNKTVNYVTCHDNYTLYDRIKAAGITDETTVKRMAMLANSVILTSNGTSFMLAGEEFLRTKGGDENSYESGYRVNELNYALKIKHYDMFENYKALIWLKKNAKGLHLTQENVNLSTNFTASASNGNALITITFKGEIDGVLRQFKVIHANGALPGGVTADFEGYSLYLDTLGMDSLTLSATTPVAKYQTIIAYK